MPENWDEYVNRECGGYQNYYNPQIVAPRYQTSLEERTRVAADIALELRVKLEKMQQFGVDSDYGEDDAFLFHRTYYSGGPEYTWVAVKVATNK